MMHPLQLVDLVLFLSRYISAHYTMDLSMHTVETRALTEAKANFIANFISLYSQIHMTDQQAVCLPSLASPSLYSFSLVSWSQTPLFVILRMRKHSHELDCTALLDNLHLEVFYQQFVRMEEYKY